MDFIDDAARCADGEEDDGDADEGISAITLSLLISVSNGVPM